MNLQGGVGSTVRVDAAQAGAREDELEEDGWACAHCTFVNHPCMNVCEICEQSRSNNADVEDSTVNDELHDVRDHLPADGTSEHQQQGPDTWICRQCILPNSARMRNQQPNEERKRCYSMEYALHSKIFCDNTRSLSISGGFARLENAACEICQSARPEPDGDGNRYFEASPPVQRVAIDDESAFLLGRTQTANTIRFGQDGNTHDDFLGPAAASLLGTLMSSFLAIGDVACAYSQEHLLFLVDSQMVRFFEPRFFAY